MRTRTMPTLSLILAMLLLVGFLPQTAKAAAGGQFEGRLVTEWLDDGRNMRLIDNFAYRSPKQQLWPVPSGAVVNGASIPRFLWSLIGSPFGDKYRKASVIHDYHCEVQLRPSEEVHHTFYEAMLDSGVGASQAWIMYQAVLRFGPSWQVSSSAACFKEDGTIDFENCALNKSPGTGTRTLEALPRPSEADIADFIADMKSGPHADAAAELERALASQ